MVEFDATFFAQIINFLILLFILGKFAYKPLMKVLDERRERVANDLETAEKTRVEAEALKAQYSKQLADAREEANAILDKANKAGQKVHDDYMAQAQAEKDQMMTAAKQTIADEKDQATGYHPGYGNRQQGSGPETEFRCRPGNGCENR